MAAEKRNRPRRNVTLSDDTWERLKAYAEENHIANGASGAIEQLIWRANVKNSQVRGQQTFSENELRGEERGRKKKGS